MKVLNFVAVPAPMNVEGTPSSITTLCPLAWLALKVPPALNAVLATDFTVVFLPPDFLPTLVRAGMVYPILDN